MSPSQDHAPGPGSRPASTAVGDHVVFEDETCRVWHLRLEPHAETDFHRHAHPYVYVVTEAGAVQTVGDGFVEPVQGDTIGMAVLRQPDAGHLLRNVGVTRYTNIIVELKGEHASPGALPDETTLDAELAERVSRLAGRNVAEGGRPFAAILTLADGTMIEAVNDEHRRPDPFGHAELNALREAVVRGNDLTGARLTASGQPCSMCRSATARLGVQDIEFLASRQLLESFGFPDAGPATGMVGRHLTSDDDPLARDPLEWWQASRPAVQPV